MRKTLTYLASLWTGGREVGFFGMLASLYAVATNEHVK